jgi:CTP synthase (UTP-ammonia lyase)
MQTIQVGLIGDRNEAVVAHRAIPRALQLAGEAAGIQVAPTWLPTEEILEPVEGLLARFDGLWCVPASPYRSTEGALAAIRWARESGTPFLGTCGGSQHALLEYAHTVLGLREAAHAETDPDAALPLLAPLTCALVEQSDVILLTPGSRLAAFYGASEVHEEYHCRYGLNPAYEYLFAGGPLAVCGRDRAGEVRAMELTTHPFFFATLFQPERAALRGLTPPLVAAFVRAAAGATAAEAQPDAGLARG